MGEPHEHYSLEGGRVTEHPAHYACRVHKLVLWVWHDDTCTWHCPVEGCRAFVRPELAGWPHA